MNALPESNFLLISNLFFKAMQQGLSDIFPYTIDMVIVFKFETINILFFNFYSVIYQYFMQIPKNSKSSTVFPTIFLPNNDK